MENLYSMTGQGADGGGFRSDLQDMGRQSVAPPLTLFVDFFPSLTAAICDTSVPLSSHSLSFCPVKIWLFCDIFMHFCTLCYPFTLESSDLVHRRVSQQEWELLGCTAAAETHTNFSLSQNIKEKQYWNLLYQPVIVKWVGKQTVVSKHTVVSKLKHRMLKIVTLALNLHTSAATQLFASHKS